MLLLMLLLLRSAPARRSTSASAAPRLGCNIKLCEARARQQDVDPGGVEDLLRGRDARGEVGVLRQAGDEEHEGARLDLQLGEVGRRGGDAGVLAVRRI
jgi:hypothetical protein